MTAHLAVPYERRVFAAFVAHQSNRAVQAYYNDPANPLGPSWWDAQQEIRDSAIDGVNAVLDGVSPEDSHENWVQFKKALGWSYGPVKDFDLKQHPCMVPYSDLSDSDKIKDHLFGAIVHAVCDPKVGVDVASVGPHTWVETKPAPENN